jgi:hypothetical protein
MTAAHENPLRIDLVSGPTGEGTVDDYELFYARRVLGHLKTVIGRQGLLDLLADDLKKGEAFLRESAEKSKGEVRPATTVLAVTGLLAAEFNEWMDQAVNDEATMLAAQPEHFVMDGRPDGTVHLVENFGPHICSCIVAFGEGAEWAATVPEFLPEADYPFKKIATIKLEDGTMVGRVLSQFGDTTDGFSASVSIYFPAACPDELFEHHRRHLAVEFTNWIKAAAAAAPDLRRTAAPAAPRN